MNLYLRLAWVLFRSVTGRRVTLEEALASHVSVGFVTLPNDLDLNLHVNNGRVLTFMDLGMILLMGRSGLFRLLLTERLRPVVGGAILRYRRSLSAFERVLTGTRLLGWDARWFYVEHRLTRLGGEEVATALVRTCVVGRAGVVPPAQVIARLGFPDAPALHRPLDAFFDGPFNRP